MSLGVVTQTLQYHTLTAGDVSWICFDHTSHFIGVIGVARKPSAEQQTRPDGFVAVAWCVVRLHGIETSCLY